jgi:predicted HAD superfamily hydrolase
MYKDFLEYDLISLDIFDTLLLRAVSKPADIFKLVWKESKKKGISLLDISPTEFMKLRIECERRARNKADNREVNLREMYNELPKFVVSDLQQLIQIEVEIEQRYCYKNFDIYKLVEVLEQLGKTIVLLSDMYLSVNQIESILTYNEIDLNKFDSITAVRSKVF